MDFATHYSIRLRIAHSPTTYTPWREVSRVDVRQRSVIIDKLDKLLWYQIVVRSEGSDIRPSLPSAVIDRPPVEVQMFGMFSVTTRVPLSHTHRRLNAHRLLPFFLLVERFRSKISFLSTTQNCSPFAMPTLVYNVQCWVAISAQKCNKKEREWERFTNCWRLHNNIAIGRAVDYEAANFNLYHLFQLVSFIATCIIPVTLLMVYGAKELENDCRCFRGVCLLKYRRREVFLC